MVVLVVESVRAEMLCDAGGGRSVLGLGCELLAAVAGVGDAPRLSNFPVVWSSRQRM